MTVNLSNFTCNDYKPPLTLEEVFRLFGTWSDLHDFSFDSLLNVPSRSVTGVISSQWNNAPIVETGNFPPSFEVQYHKTSFRQGVQITTDGNEVMLWITTDSSGHPQIYRWGGLVQNIPIVTPEEADVRVVFRQQQNTDDQTQVWQSVTVYMNGTQITTVNLFWTTVYTNLHVGFIAYGTDVVSYTNIRVPELCDTAEFGTLDPGAFPTDGLQQTIEGRYLKYFIRFDGSLRAWKVKSIASQISIPAENLDENDVPGDLSQFANHVRMMGAWLWAEAIDFQLAVKYGHRFQEMNNSMLLTKQECYLEAANSIKRFTENSFNEKITMPVIPFLEVEDRITTPEGDWIITSYELQLNIGEIAQQIIGRKYVWG